MKAVKDNKNYFLKFDGQWENDSSVRRQKPPPKTTLNTKITTKHE